MYVVYYNIPSAWLTSLGEMIIVDMGMQISHGAINNSRHITRVLGIGHAEPPASHQLKEFDELG